MERTEINVYPVPNGHVLKVGSNEYMYFTVAELLEGFMYHVGLEELNAIDSETMREFLTASIVWKDHGETVKELVKVKKDYESLSNTAKNMRKQIKRLTERLRSEDDDDV